ncbi:MAG: hypothetical protein JWO38_3958 [Gemmataceae bacterium]|nr:hypothetical protein [Gemmataceae bacterium]
MSILGKLLLVVNLLAAGGFGYLALQDWKGRQAITAAGLRHVILLQGVPLDGGPDQLPARVASTSDGFHDYASTEIPFRVEMAGGVPTESVSPELLYAYFAAAGSAGAGPAGPVGGDAAGGAGSLAGPTPVASQMAELKRVYGILKAEIQKKDGGAARTAQAGAWLLLQAESIEERIETLVLIAAGNGNELAHRLDLKFYRVAPALVEAGPIQPDLWQSLSGRIEDLKAQQQKADDAAAAAEKDADAAEKDVAAAKTDGSPAAAVEAKQKEAMQKRREALEKRGEALARAREIERRSPHKPKDQPETRARLAHLLVHLDPTSAWQKRVMMVVGVRQYVKTLTDQVIRFKDMVARVERATVDDQDRFSRDYAHLRGLAIERTQEVRGIAEIRAQMAVQVQKDEDIVKQRETELQGLKTQLAKVKAEVNDLLAKQTLAEQQLFTVQQEVGRTLEEIYRLEAELAKKETETYGRKK